jgi:hypothetical protein
MAAASPFFGSSFRESEIASPSLGPIFLSAKRNRFEIAISSICRGAARSCETAAA